MMYLGDFRDDQTVHFMWSTNGADGASITRSTNGTVSVYKDNGTTQTTTGVTDTEDFDALTGIHACTIVTTDSFYSTGANFTVVLSGATIDGKAVNAVLAHFSILNRSIPTAIENADALLKRDWTSVTGEAARSVLNALRAIRNKWSITGTTLTVTKEDDSTAAYTAALTEAAGANPYSASDPT